MKRVTVVFITLILLIGMFPVPALAARDYTQAEEQAQALKDYGLFIGTGSGFDLKREPTRAEALAMLIRSLGKEAEAKNYIGKTPFTDLKNDWAKPYITYAYEKKLTMGATTSTFNPDGIADSQMYLVFVLRALGYSDAANKDFTYSDPYTLARSVGILTSSVDTKTFLRADVVLVSYASLSAKLKGTTTTLLEKLGLTDDPHEVELVKITASGIEELYKNLNKALEKFPKNIEITPTGAWSKITINELFDKSFECAATYLSSAQCKYFDNSNVLTLIPDYSDAALALAYGLGWREKADTTVTKLYNKAAEILETLKLEGMDQRNAVEAIHDYIADNTRYKITTNGYTAYGVLLEGAGVCDGYAYAFWLLCNLAGINCIRVSGDATDENGNSEAHAWNKVQIDGLWYNVDVTWDDPVFYYNGVLTDTIRTEYFLISDEVISADHTWYQYEAMPAA